METVPLILRSRHTLDLKALVRNAAGEVSFTLKEAGGCILSGTVLTSGDK